MMSFHKALFIPVLLLGALVLVACADDGDLNFNCKEGQTQCQGDLVQVCQEEAWVDTEDCAESGLTCGVSEGMAQCLEGDEDGDTDDDDDDNTDDDDDDDNADGDTDDDDDDADGDLDGDEDGDLDGDEDGDLDGDEDGDLDGDVDGDLDGDEDGDLDGDEDGDLDGDVDGDLDGDEDGDLDGDEDGDLDGDVDGDLDGDEDGDLDGDEDGDLDGDEEIEYPWVIINEIASPQTGLCYVELLGESGVNLTNLGLSLVVTDRSGASLADVPLAGIIPEDGYFVLGSQDVDGVDMVLMGVCIAQTPVSLLLEAPNGDVLDSVATGAFLAGDNPLGEGSPALEVPNEGSLARCADGVDTDDNQADFTVLLTASVGSENACENCIDPDNDGYGEGDGCMGPDGCPNDPNKTEEGVCGCGVADTDTDTDGTADCVDGCPNDPNKTEEGVCSCGVADTDTDTDGTADCMDGCPNDPNKTEEGVCGCGVADTDTDTDGTADCVDGCPNDPNKTEEGVCGCGVADTDTDTDGTADCMDGCPNDPNKTEPGLCGCGVEEGTCACEGVVCGNHAHCEGGNCFCDDGYQGNPILGCTLIDPCAGIVCGDHAYCSDGDCYCENGYSGDPLTACTPTDTCLGVVCGDHANCQNGQCFCDTDYEGDPVSGCTVIDYCESVDCTSDYSAYSHCVVNLDLAANYECVCDDGYEDIGGTCSLWCEDDGHEENDDFDTATLLTLPTDWTDLVAMRPTDASGDSDYYLFALEEDEVIEVSVLFDNSEGNIDIHLYAAGDTSTPVASGVTWSDNEFVTYQARTSGYYYLEVIASQTYVCNGYELHAAIRENPCQQEPSVCSGDHELCVYEPNQAPYYDCVCEEGYNRNVVTGICESWCPDDEYEPNDTPETATPVTAGFSRGGLVASSDSVDYYRFTLSPNTSFRAEISLTSSLGDLDLFLYDESLQELDRGFTTMDLEHVEIYTETGGTFYLLVNTWIAAGSTDQVCNSYEMTLSSEVILNPCNEANPPCSGTDAICNFDHQADPVYFCSCPEGMVFDSTGENCTSDPCENVDCASEIGVNSHCQEAWDTPPTYYTCECNDSFVLDNGTCVYDCQDDLMEENDTKETALDVNIPYSNSMLVAKYGDEGSDYDWFSFDLNQGDIVEIEALFYDEFGDLDIHLYSSGMTTLAASTSLTDNELIRYQINSTGTYFLRVRSYSSLTCNPYTLNISIMDNPCDANPCAGDHQVCDFDYEENTYSCDCEDGYEMVNGVCESSACNGIDCTALVGPSECVLDASQPEGYYCDCDDYYVMSNEGQCEDFCPPDAMEDDDTSATANVVTLPFANGDLNARREATERDYDWFAFDLEAGETLTIQADFVHESGDIDIYLYNYQAGNTGGSSVASSVSMTDNESITYDVETSGRYYLKVTPFTANTCHQYSLSIDAAQDDPCQPDPCTGDNDRCVARLGEDPAYECVCNAGYYPDPENGGACVNPCDGQCTDPNEECTVLVGEDTLSFECSCEEGTFPTPDGNGCADPCDRPRCDDYEVCISEDWESYRCECVADDFEDNDTSAEARLIPVPFQGDQLSMFYESGNDKDHDWYRFNLEAGQDVRITASFTHSMGDIDIYLFDYAAANVTYPGDGSELVRSATASSNEVMIYQATETKTYYLYVTPYSVMCNGYTLTVETGPCYDNPCSELDHSNGTCITDTDDFMSYNCGCEQGYVWNEDNGICVPDVTTYCHGYPDGLDIPDNSSLGVDTTIEIGDSVSLDDGLCLTVDITHLYRGDLKIMLENPDGFQSVARSVDLSDSTQNLISGYELTDFNGTNILGTWTLNVSDQGDGYVGHINQWCVRPGPCPAGTPLDL